MSKGPQSKQFAPPAASSAVGRAGTPAAGARALRFTAGAPAIPLGLAASRLGGELGDEVRRSARRLPLRFPEEYLDIVPPDAADPLRRIAWPDPEENAPDPSAIDDPVGERSLRPHPALVRKYADRALLLVTSRCHFYCRFCFRAGGGADPSLDDLDRAIDLVAADPRVREVILSGGDPLVLPDFALAHILASLGRVRSLERVRLHTRAPVHDPRRITRELGIALVEASPRPLRVVIHASHPRELRPALDCALEHLARAGLELYDQTVLLAGVNDDAGTLISLFEGLAARGVRPYYLHHPDRIAGTARFRVGLRRGLALYDVLRTRLAPAALPRYVIDLPDGSGKVDVASLEALGGRRWRTPNGAIYDDIE